VRRLAAAGRLPELATRPLRLRARHVLEDSGSVDWDDKRDVYRAAATVAVLRPAIFRAPLDSYHAVSGSLDPAEALALLDSLHLPADTEHLPQLRAALREGVANHYKDPAAWRV
jgi:cytochrome c-type biogenesis protein CcmH/NrfG